MDILRNKYNPEGSLLRNHQLRMLDILKEFDRVCKEHNLKYWLTYGTCLGAVRHKGFIPWDDDLDVAMLREDFLKFVKIYKENDRYVLQTNINDPYYTFSFAKLRDKYSFIKEHGHDNNYKYRGIFIDIFFIEPSYLSISKFFSNKTLQIVWLGGGGNHRILRKYLFFAKKYYLLFQISIVRLLLRPFKSKTWRIGYGALFYSERKLENIFPLKELEFEGNYFYGPCNTDAYLKALYGDYMTLPNSDKLELHTTYTEIFR